VGEVVLSVRVYEKPDMGALYVGYKAPVRIAEMQHDVPLLFEKKSEDKYMQRKLNIDRIDEWYPLLKPDLQDVVDQYYNNKIIGGIQLTGVDRVEILEAEL
jgi:hypothetical protein